jgi:hypothetical protein
VLRFGRSRVRGPERSHERAARPPRRLSPRAPRARVPARAQWNELGRFVDHLDASGIETITIEVALAWATRSPTRWLLIRCDCERSAASRGTCGRSMFRSRCHQRSAPGPTSAARAVSLYRRGDRAAGAGGRDAAHATPRRDDAYADWAARRHGNASRGGAWLGPR